MTKGIYVKKEYCKLNFINKKDIHKCTDIHGDKCIEN